MKTIRIFSFLVLLVTMVACSGNAEPSLPPKIILDSSTSTYSVKVGIELIIAPSYENVDEARYRWVIEGKDVSGEPVLKYSFKEEGEYFGQITVVAKGGTASAEFKIKVTKLDIPQISFPGAENGFIIEVEDPLLLSPSISKTQLAQTYSWKVNGAEKSTSAEYIFVEIAPAIYTVNFTASTTDGEDSIEFKVDVRNPEDMPFSWEFEKDVYTGVVGRTVYIKPLSITSSEEYSVIWKLEGEVISVEELCAFVPEKKGNYKLQAQLNDSRAFIRKELEVNIYGEDDFYRPSSSSSAPAFSKVYEYLPAPGQFIGETKAGGFDGSETTMQKAIEYAEKRLQAKQWISLGGFGGYVVAGFDHSVDNSGGYDFAIKGNSIETCSEPGVVWVMQDENGDGLPNDTWYELSGSETGGAQTVQEYAVTYYRPKSPNQDVEWTDNLGNSGTIDYMGSYHNQDYYYPAWVSENSYTLRGTRLEARNYDASGKGTQWILPPYTWGYADNYSPVDRDPNGQTPAENEVHNYFKISNAIDIKGNAVNLKHIDFIKVQTALNTKSGWLGECSTEVCDIFDYNLSK